MLPGLHLGAQSSPALPYMCRLACTQLPRTLLCDAKVLERLCCLDCSLVCESLQSVLLGLQDARSRQGKMEKSFLSFAATYPSWEPAATAKQMLACLGQEPGSGVGPHVPWTAMLGSRALSPGEAAWKGSLGVVLPSPGSR